MKDLIVDYIPFEVSPQQINESLKENDGKLVVKGVLQILRWKSKRKSISKRYFDERADKYNDGFIKQNTLGELDYPDSSVVNLQNVSHNVTETIEGDNLLGTVEILTTPSGNILRELFKNEWLGISSRGLGSVEL